jgi:alpha-tubulin suppressor-like RCC1 family protein
MLGNGTNVASSEPVRVAGGRKYTTLSVAIGSHTCAVTRAGEPFCWGGNDDGQLGDGSTQSRNAPVPVAGNHRFASIAAGHFHTCAVTLDDEVYCWGGKNTPPLTGRDGGSLVPIQVRPERMAVQRP